MGQEAGRRRAKGAPCSVSHVRKDVPNLKEGKEGAQRPTGSQWESQVVSVRSYAGRRDLWASGDNGEALGLSRREGAEGTTLHTGRAMEEEEGVDRRRSGGQLLAQASGGIQGREETTQVP